MSATASRIVSIFPPIVAASDPNVTATTVEKSAARNATLKMSRPP